MRLRFGLLAFAAVVLLAVGSGACKFSGVSAVYMAIDQNGAQPRTVFYTDSNAIFCVAKESSAKQDVTVDFYVHQVPGPLNEQPIHNLFSVDEQTPGPGTEAPVSFQIPPNGITIMISCEGYCIQNGFGCMTDYSDEGNDSCGIGLTCCFNPLVMTPSGTPTIIPYPVGNYTCEVDIDGDTAGVTDFSIEYPPADANGYICPFAPPVSGIICAGWVPQGAKCPGFNSNEMCVCNGAAWQCM